MTRHLAKLLDAIWTLSMGLFLGLTGGMVLSVILTFRGARAIDATPGVEPFTDPMFAEYHNEAVAGYIGQDLFNVGGVIVLFLLHIAIVSVMSKNLMMRFKNLTWEGNAKVHFSRGILLVLCLGFTWTAGLGPQEKMAREWPGLYDVQATDAVLAARRTEFDRLHQKSEKLTSIAWLCGLIALGISPWCRRIADEPSKAKSEDEK